MYERFTDRARKVMQLAYRQATCRYAPELGSEHILLGLFEEGSGVAANVLRRLGGDSQKLWEVASARCKLHPPPPTHVAPSERTRSGWQASANAFWQFLTGRRNRGLPQNVEAKRVIEHAMEEARALGHNYVGTEHLLLGLLRQPNSTAAQVLVESGLTLEGVRREVLELLGQA